MKQRIPLAAFPLTSFLPLEFNLHGFVMPVFLDPDSWCMTSCFKPSHSASLQTAPSSSCSEHLPYLEETPTPGAAAPCTWHEPPSSPLKVGGCCPARKPSPPFFRAWWVSLDHNPYICLLNSISHIKKVLPFGLPWQTVSCVPGTWEALVSE